MDIKWQVNDGYRGGYRPQCSNVELSDFEEDMSIDDIKEVIQDIIQEDFNQNIGVDIDDLDSAARGIHEMLQQACDK
jgi:hypothetical protein